MNERWQNQQEAFEFAMSHNACMLDMDMGTGKTRVAIDVAFERKDAHRVLVVCPKAVIGVWRENLQKFRPNECWSCWDENKGTIKKKSESLKEWLHKPATKQFAVINYDSVWRKELGDLVLKSGFNMVILDESHRAKSAGSKVSKFLAMLGRRVKYRMCLSGTPMANSPLDVYGQYRFLDPTIYGTNFFQFKTKYAILGGPDHNFVVGFRNQQDLNNKFKKIAYSCKMKDVAERIKLPKCLPNVDRRVNLPAKDMRIMKTLNKEFVAECGSGHIVVNNVLTKLIRMQQITSGFCYTQKDIIGDKEIQEMNTAKMDSLVDMLADVSANDPVVVFCQFKHDLDSIHVASEKAGRKCFEVSGTTNELEQWQKDKAGSIIAVQIQAGSEGIDMTRSNYAVYYSIPHSLAQYEQSRARLYRPGQTKPVSFHHIIANGTIDEALYRSLMKKDDIIKSIKEGTFDFGYLK